ISHRAPDVHLGVVSSSFGAGAWGNVKGCEGGVHPGDDRGFFLQGPGGAGQGACTMLHAGETFLQTGDASAGTKPNFDGDFGAAFSCLTQLGENGCPYGSPFES